MTRGENISLDSTLILGAYGLAFIKPIRKLYYNPTITFVSVVVAVFVGGIEALGLLSGQIRLRGPLWTAIATLNGNFCTLGYIIVGIFATSWLVSIGIYRFKRYDYLDTYSIQNHTSPPTKADPSIFNNYKCSE